MADRPPDVFLIGVPRSGTTSLYYAARQHPSIFAPDQKEACYTCPELDPGTRRTQTRWFSADERDEYLALFAAAGPDQLILEGCIYNVYSPTAPTRIRELNPGARFLLQLRDPIDQMYSNHGLKVIMRDTPADDFGAAIAVQDTKRGARAPSSQPPSNFVDYDLRDKATISFGLAAFLREFERDRFHVTFYDDYARDPLAITRATFEFLGIDPSFRPSVDVMVPNRVARIGMVNRAMGSARVIGAAKGLVPRRLHPAARRLAQIGFRVNRRVEPRQELETGLRDRLRADFRPEVERLSELLDMDLVARWWS